MRPLGVMPQASPPARAGGAQVASLSGRGGWQPPGAPRPPPPPGGGGGEGDVLVGARGLAAHGVHRDGHRRARPDHGDRAGRALDLGQVVGEVLGVAVRRRRPGRLPRGRAGDVGDLVPLRVVDGGARPAPHDEGVGTRVEIDAADLEGLLTGLGIPGAVAGTREVGEGLGERLGVEDVSGGGGQDAQVLGALLVGEDEAVPDARLGVVAVGSPGLLAVLVEGDQGALGVAVDENGALAVGAHEVVVDRAGHVGGRGPVERDQRQIVSAVVARQRRVVPEADLVAVPRPHRGLIR